jgi:cytochrome P450
MTTPTTTDPITTIDEKAATMDEALRRSWAVPRTNRRPEDTGATPSSPEAGHSVWHIDSLALARRVLRLRHGTRQAGFTAERIPDGVFRHRPILISDGARHEEQRRAVARLLSPKVLTERYGDFVDGTAAALADDAARRGHCRLDRLALMYSVRIAAQVVGLTASPVPAMPRRLEAFFRQPPLDMTKNDLGRSSWQWIKAAWFGLAPLVRFYLFDVRPAIRDHRDGRSHDVISHLMDQGYRSTDILIECLTYGTAGMVTTREFISMACWRLLRDDELRACYLSGTEEQRSAILNEIIRIDPVVGHLYRRVTAPLATRDGGYDAPVGALIDLDVRRANKDAAVGPDADLLCPTRRLPPAQQAALSFGDGPHRCPGQPLALMETDALLRRLLARNPRIARPPTIGWDDPVAGYRLRRFELVFDGERPGENRRRSTAG